MAVLLALRHRSLTTKVASSKARNSSTWRLRQENERLQKAEAAWKEQQAHGAGGDCSKPMAATGSAVSDDAMSTTEVQALYAKVRDASSSSFVLLCSGTRNQDTVQTRRTGPEPPPRQDLLFEHP